MGELSMIKFSQVSLNVYMKYVALPFITLFRAKIPLLDAMITGSKSFLCSEFNG